jgi:hypothetical protein
MERALLGFVFIFAAFAVGWAQNPESGRCSTIPQFEPTLVSNGNAEVTFACPDATPLELIESIGRQTRIPIGIVLGQDSDLLSKMKRNFQLFEVDAKSALLEAVTGTGYTVSESGDGFVLIAGDLTPRQSDVLNETLSGFGPRSDVTMALLAAQLTMWLQSAVDHPTGFIGSIGSSTNEERFTLPALPPMTVQQIADEIVSLGSKGLWILTTDPVQQTSQWTDGVRIEPYQHYSNRPLVEPLALPIKL